MLASPIVDLSHPLHTGEPAYPGDPTVEIIPRLTHAEHGHAVTEIRMGTHDGTHMDAGYHFFADKPTLDQYPVERFVGSGVVLDLRAQPADTPVAPDTLRAAIAAAGGLHAGDFALLWYGWDAHYGGDLMWRNPYLSKEAARLLVDTGVTLVATDTPNVDSSTDLTAFPVHVLFLGSGLLIVENLRALDRLGAGRVDCVLLPLSLAHTDGAPVRAIAWPRAETVAAGRPVE
ncbi:MAG: cyclase family protein [Thermoleophilia bacterium]|nr:cyclase family protein [Thermoleophilia bacterium]